MDTWPPARVSPPHSQRLTDICSTRISLLVECQPSTASRSNSASCCEPVKTFQYLLPSKCLPQKITAQVGFYVNAESAGIIHVQHTGSLLQRVGGKGRHKSRAASFLALTAICEGSKLQAAVSLSARQTRLLGNGRGLFLLTSLPML